MNLHEFRVMEALNIASTRHGRMGEFGGYQYQATAAQVAEVFTEQTGATVTALSIGATLRVLRRQRHRYLEPLVERVGTRKWRMTDHGAGTMIS